MPLPKIPPPFHAIITSSSNKLHASMNNHFKCSIEFNRTPNISMIVAWNSHVQYTIQCTTMNSG